MEKTLKLYPVTLFLCLAGTLTAADFPQDEISNGIIKAKILLPDTEHGYYRGTRFDWDGVVESLTYQGHNFFGKWFDKYEPTLHDAIMGPVEEFRTGTTALGYDEAKPGGLFVKIGVGLLKKIDDQKYSQFRTYPLVNSGTRVVTPERDHVTFQHDLRSEGYSYEYRKTLRLPFHKPELVIEHSLKNTGSKVIETDVYNHDFYMIDNQPAGPSYRVAFTTPISGFSDKPVDNDIIVENTTAKAGVQEIGNRPLSNIDFWTIRSTVCPEGYIHMRIEPGKTYTWKITYRFYTLPLPNGNKKKRHG